ncbi:MAG: hypothetical protein A3I44_03835 [Candidatus Sungbacteria bacterium RIFCSPLOWO2_02_FULL_51_17]|uniref:DUF58 domain-containing protein n=1 Tax=Candidatus Sungbacteria bacterium RIFCSPHIGHO2_02_FULL_51_29 TaxID=1802273 RepID=A0A1G2KPZ0_9BACT|nr:MAG: hypothetical protein A2676_02355 [Candidatus Sungbacteria bacterium RIFCSPHIGHO2_01_FULL_51_22]OHA01478.1 MAG: hypothetical protein A3C16_05530 [Candidatus Sungbacteria bacterium RIFCSPHIGHO2_02_FULL_51_29]OHA11217.1 MAG: hypothetical protein A3I44_03835 [Candidatus Sungbacteria bacterium RIFCSPLOWO2_02_FULL_51_17]
MTKKELARFLQKFALPEPEFHVWTLTFGEHRSRLIGEGIEFKEFTEYEPGEDVTDIDPEVTLREGKPMVRKNLTEEKMRHAILFDDSPSLRYYGMRETAIVALGCYLLSSTALKDPVRVVALNGGASPFVSPLVYGADDVAAVLYEVWDMPQRTPVAPTTLEACSNDAAHVLSLDNTRLLFISDFLFADTKPVYDHATQTVVLDGRDILRRAVGGTYAGGTSSMELAFLGVSPQWETFRDQVGFYYVVDAENGSTSLEHFTKRSARKFIERQLAGERAWVDAARSLGAPMGWVRTGDPAQIVQQLERSFGG